MSDTQPSIKERVSDALKMGQEPKDRLWGAVYVLIVLVAIVGLLVVFTQNSTRNALDENTTLGFERGATYCMTVVVDGDRTFDLPNYCQRPEVVVHYPPEVCVEFFPDDGACSREWDG